MLHFRVSTILKESFEATLKRPFPAVYQKSWLPTRRRRCCCFSTVSCDARLVSSRLNVLHIASLRTAPCATPARLYCVKTEGAAVEPDEHVKKDGSGSEENEKYVLLIYGTLLVLAACHDAKYAQADAAWLVNRQKLLY